MENRINHCVECIRNLTDRKPEIGITLGSGLGDFVEQLTDKEEIPFSSIEGFPTPTVKGHEGKLIFGTYNGVDENDNTIVVKSKVMDAIDLGYNKIVVETPKLDEDGKVVMKRNKPVADASKRDTENVPLSEDIDAYFKREVIPYNPLAWIDKKKTKVGYEIPFTRTFYEYKQIEPSDVIAARIEEHEKSLMAKLHDLFGGE